MDEIHKEIIELGLRGYFEQVSVTFRPVQNTRYNRSKSWNGFAMVQHATQAGHRVYALSRTIQYLKKSDLLYPYAIDLTDENAIADLQWLKQQGVQIDALVNNAGALENKPLAKLQLQFLNQFIELMSLVWLRLHGCFYP